MEKLIGIIGGSGLSEIDGFEFIREEIVETPFGDPSSPILIGELEGQRIAFLARHGRSHFISPTAVNYRANIYAMKKLGVEQIIALSAVGSMKEEIRPKDFVIVDQLFDRTKNRVSTFFDHVGMAVHVSMADPFCKKLSASLFEACKKLEIPVHNGGTYVCIEGPQFSTRAESNIYRQWGVDVIGMTNIPESKLAREAEICFATVALATDYDVWHTAEDVSAGAVMEYMKENIKNVKILLKEIMKNLPDTSDCSCRSSLVGAIMTDEKVIPEKTFKDLKPIIGKYYKK